MNRRIRTATVIVLVLCAICVSAGIGIAQTKAPTPQVVFLNLRLRGFEPSTATAKPGKMFLLIHNHTGRPTVTVNIASTKGLPVSAQGAPQVDLPTRGSVPHGSIFLNLGAGIYTITEAHEAKWTCVLTVQ